MSYKDPKKQKEYQTKQGQFYQDFYKKHKKRLRDFLEIKTCLNCQKRFQPKNKQQKFCSHNCRCKYYYRLNPEKRTKATPEQQKNASLKMFYGITLEEYKVLLRKQKGVCAICSKKESRRSKYGGVCDLHIDHNHKNKKVRGLLCNKCNRGLGFFDEDIELLKQAIKYLKNQGVR